MTISVVSSIDNNWELDGIQRVQDADGKDKMG
jgi:hypothetical protein